MFTFELVEERNGVVYVTKTFSEVPVNSFTKGEMHISTLGDVNKLELDTDSDGTPDITVYADEYQEPASFTLLEKEIQKLDTKAKKQLLQKLYSAERFADRGYMRLVEHILNLLEQKIIFFSSEKRPKNMQIPKSEADHIVLIIKEFKELL